MKSKGILLRTIALASFVGVLLLLFVFRLIKMQIVETDQYSAMADMGITREQTVKAARGEIVDRYGRPLVVNESGFQVTLDRAYLPRGRENEIILRLTEMLSAAGESWTDNLPLSQEAPFVFLEGRDGDISRLKNFLEVNTYASAEDVTGWLISRYQLEDYPPQEQRVLMAIRYEMERRGFSITTPYTLAEDVDISTVMKLEENSFTLPGMSIAESAIRQYVSGEAAPHLIGQVGPIYAEEYATLDKDEYSLDDITGKSGIEKAFESELRGQNGKRQISLNSAGDVVEVKETLAPVPGHTIVLTIDKELQLVAQNALEEEIRYLNATAPEGEGKEACAGAAVAINNKTGEILACATWPGYDLQTYRQDYNLLAADDRNPLFNRALDGVYAAGSIYKPSVATAGLMEGLITPSTTYDCLGVYTYWDDYQPKCLGYHPGYNVSNALRVSCNIFFYDLGRRLGIDTINRYSTMFGLGQPTGIELPESLGHLAGPEYSESHGQEWHPGNVVQAAIGQSDNGFTPLQLATYTATLANGGVRMKSHLVKGVTTYGMEETVYETAPEVAVDMHLTEEAVQAVRTGMRWASGRDGMAGTSGFVFANYPIDVASKTGTPETQQFPNSTYICYAPSNDPEIAVAVVIEKGWHGYTGAPVAKAIFDQYFFHKQEIQAPQALESLLQ
ncbi:MAG: penicillin-binding transpeptidase domain-containing protein [Oscillospiraceae bacterium]|nr:penicillin-binding transpeptidase domain-containing protein [Oscillospiraceae bacterium]